MINISRLSIATWLARFGLGMLIVGLFFSRAAISIGMMVLVGNALLFAPLGPTLERFRKHSALLALCSLFFLFLLGGLYSDNTAWWLDRMRMKLPFLVLPFAFSAIPHFSRAIYDRFLAGFFWIVLACSVVSLASYLMQYEAITESYRRGKVLPTPVQHIPFSLMVTIGIALGWHLYREGFTLLWPGEKGFVLGGTVFLVVFLHVLAVRTGLVAFYALAAALLARYILRTRRYALGLIGLLTAALALGLAYRYVPTFHNKMEYMRYSIDMYWSGDAITAFLSDSYRLATIEAGLHIGAQHPWFGVGIGDLLDATGAYLRDHYPQLTEELYMPQSQYVLVFAACGALGWIWFTAATLMPLAYRRGWRNRLALSIHLVFLVSLVVEQPLENQLGTALYLTFVLMDLRFRAPPTSFYKSEPHAAA